MKIIVSIHLPGCSNTKAEATDIPKGATYIGIAFKIACQRQRFLLTVCHECIVLKRVKRLLRFFI